MSGDHFSIDQKMLDKFPAMIGYWDKNLLNKFSNSAYLKFFKMTPDKIYNKHIRDVIGEELYQKNLPFLEGVLKGKEQFFDREIPLPDGTVSYTHAMYFPDIEDGEVVGFYVLVTDLSNLKLLEQEKNSMQQKLIQSYKMIALGEMAGGIAHEINNPLSIISMSAEFARELIEDYDMDRTKLLNYVTKIQSTSQRIQKIVSGLQFFSKENPDQYYSNFSVASILEDTTSFCVEKFRKRQISFSIPKVKEDLIIECDAVQISQIILNLLNNASDAVENVETKWISLIVRDKIESVEILVVDNGKGIPLEIRDKLMQPFVTTKETGKGVGLGLSISKGIAEKHGGKLEIDPVATNTTFILRLPKKQKR